MKNKLAFLFLFLCVASTSFARNRQNFDCDWLFVLGNEDRMSAVGYDDSSWRKLDVPHDWAAEGDFSSSNKSGAGGGALPGGIGWYRKHFTIDSNDGYEKYFIEFDGVYMNSTVYVNGNKVGFRPYGYSSFEYDITPYIIKGGDNVVAVKVDNSDQPNSRWYSGCGIYRHVWLTRSHSTHIAHWGVGVESTVRKSKGTLKVSVAIEGKGKVENVLYDASGRQVAKGVGENCVLTVNKPSLWSVESPYLYKLRTRVIASGKVVDEEWTTTGFRTFCFDAEKGFSLNGKSMKINGVCEHHDFGCLGSAFNEDALHRKLTLLREMGVNSIRSSHNPPAPELLNMCDSMGFIVMDESFDMWRRKKTQNDYARFFDEWHERDLTDLVVRDRNHPCILMWSIGNEVLEQWSSADADTLTLEQANLILNAGHDASTLAKDGELSVNSLLTQHLAEIIKRYDTTRPVTAGCNEPDPNNHLFKSGAIDLIGFNYHRQWIKDVPKNFPGKPFIMTESVSALQTRGYYGMPSDKINIAPERWDLPFTDPTFMCSSYDNMHAPWSSTHEQTWDIVKNTPYCGGQFIWTGWDYIGEPTPYGFPAHSSYFGIIDLAGFPKDVYYMYQSEWTDKDVLHLFPHWNWIPGQDIDMWCYYNHADEVELFINGKSQGTLTKAVDNAPIGDATRLVEKGSLITPYHVAWRVKYEPGQVKVVARKDGKVVGEKTINTAGSPCQIRLTPDKTVLNADGKSLSFITVEVLDKDGNLCPNAENQIFFNVEGQGRIEGVDNGSQFSMERYTADNRKAFFGKCMVVVRSSKEAGQITVTAKGVDLKDAKVVLETK